MVVPVTLAWRGRYPGRPGCRSCCRRARCSRCCTHSCRPRAQSALGDVATVDESRQQIRVVPVWCSTTPSTHERAAPGHEELWTMSGRQSSLLPPGARPPAQVRSARKTHLASEGTSDITPHALLQLQLLPAISTGERRCSATDRKSRACIRSSSLTFQSSVDALLNCWRVLATRATASSENMG